MYYRLEAHTVLCTCCNPIERSQSGLELFLLEFIKNNYSGEIIKNPRNIIAPYELDIYLPELNIAFEFNGLYWHSELYKSKDYHRIKTDMCLKSGIKLIHIWEDDWLYKQNIIKSMILNELRLNPSKIWARKCEIREIIGNTLSMNFLDNNHLQGNLNSSIKVGLYYNNELVSLMTFGKKRIALNSKSKEDEWELLRFCSKLNTSVIGGASRLFKYFINKYNPVEVVTYADRSFSSGKLYNVLGFKFDHITDNGYHYIIDGIREHRFNFRKDILVKQGFDVSKSESQIMLERGYHRLYNSGNLYYIFKK
jgi:hypothetical protein